MADTAVARAGKPAMGVSSCFGSPLLNDVLGLGIALTVSCTSVHHMCSVHHVVLYICWLVSQLVSFKHDYYMTK